MDNEFDYESNERSHYHHLGETMPHSGRPIARAHSNASGITTTSEMDSAALNPEIPLLTYGQEVN